MRKILSIGVVLALALAGAGCGSSAGGDPADSVPPEPPLQGAGSRLIVPLISKWEADYARRTGEKVTYRPVGDNGLDIGPVGSDAAAFGTEDAPLTPPQFGEGEGNIQMIPWALTGVAVVYNVKGIPAHLKLNSDVLTDIYLGDITAWNDPAIASLNPGVPLPNTPIVPVFRSDESGEEYVFTDFLTVTSKKFSDKYGISRIIPFTVGTSVKGDGGLSAKLTKTDGAIGYMRLPYAINQGFDIALIENPAGNFPKPIAKNLTAGGEAGIELGPNNEVWTKELPRSAKNAYPLVAFNYAIVRVQTEEAARLKRFLSYAISPAGQAYAAGLHFAPLAPAVLAHDKRAIAVITP